MSSLNSRAIKGTKNRLNPNSKTSPQGVGRRYAHVVLRKADIDLTKRAGELTEDEVRREGGLDWGLPWKGSLYLTFCPACQVERVITIMQNPRQYKIPDWFLNRQKDVKDGKYSQVCIKMGEIRGRVCLVRICPRRSEDKHSSPPLPNPGPGQWSGQQTS